ncbi:uncharacterized protein V6R79_023362 [Siganus canaliculatus]
MSFARSRTKDNDCKRVSGDSDVNSKIPSDQRPVGICGCRFQVKIRSRILMQDEADEANLHDLTCNTCKATCPKHFGALRGHILCNSRFQYETQLSNSSCEGGRRVWKTNVPCTPPQWTVMKVNEESDAPVSHDAKLRPGPVSVHSLNEMTFDTQSFSSVSATDTKNSERPF